MKERLLHISTIFGVLFSLTFVIESLAGNNHITTSPYAPKLLVDMEKAAMIGKWSGTAVVCIIIAIIASYLIKDTKKMTKKY